VCVWYKHVQNGFLLERLDLKLKGRPLAFVAIVVVAIVFPT
jgi:hypothetical protein